MCSCIIMTSMCECVCVCVCESACVLLYVCVYVCACVFVCVLCIHAPFMVLPAQVPALIYELLICCSKPKTNPEINV